MSTGTDYNYYVIGVPTERDKMLGAMRISLWRMQAWQRQFLSASARIGFKTPSGTAEIQSTSLHTVSPRETSSLR